MTSETLEAIKKRNEEWRESFVHGFRCQECGAGQEGHPSPADIDSLIAEVERLREALDDAAQDGALGMTALLGELERLTRIIDRPIASVTMPAGTLKVGDKIKFNSGGNEA